MSSSSPSSSFTFLVTLQLLVMSLVDRVLDEVDWLIARKKSQTTVNKSGSGRRPLHNQSFTVLPPLDSHVPDV